MQTPREILADLWTRAGRRSCRARRGHADGRRAAIAVLVPRRRRGAGERSPRRDWPPREIWKLRSGQAQDVAVDMRHAVVECRTRALSARRRQAAAAGLGCDRRHLQDPRRALRAAAHQFPRIIATPSARCWTASPSATTVQAALMQWDGEAFETAAYAAGGVVAMMRSHRGMVGDAACQGAGRTAAGLDREDRRGPAEAVARRATARSPACACSICRA